MVASERTLFTEKNENFILSINLDFRDVPYHQGAKERA